MGGIIMSIVKTGFPSIDKTHLVGIPQEELHPEIHNWSMYKTFMKMNEGYMDQSAVYDNDGEHSKESLVVTIKSYACSLLELNVKCGASAIAMAVPNSFSMVAIVMAANALAVKVFFLDYLDPIETLLEKAKGIGAKFLFTQDAIYNVSSGLSITWKIFEHSLGYGYEERIDSILEKFECWDKPLIFLQTSGSTSVPKVLPFTNSAIYATMLFALNSTKIENHHPTKRKLMTILSARLPFGFMTGFVPILWGQEVVFASGAKPEDIAQYYKYNAFLIFGTPVLLQAMMKLTPKNADLSSLYKFYSSGLSTPEELYPAAKEFFKAHNSKAKICNNYGFGEGLGIGTASDTVEHLPGTSGKFYIGPEWVIVDDNMNEVKYGEAGELIVKSPTLCEGYLDNPEATAEAFMQFRDEIYFKTGDYVSVDEAGYVSYLGRKKRFFQPTGAGDKVSCEMIEKVLYEIDFVDQAAVVPVQDANGVTYGKAFVAIKNGAIVDDDEALSIIQQYFDFRLKDFQIPKDIVFLDKLPLMASGKIDYRLLQQS